MQPLYAEECYGKLAPESVYFENDSEVEAANRKRPANFVWPPPINECHDTPTAAPLYIPPPETQHVVTKPPIHREQVQQIQSQNPTSQAQWQSHSAPALSAGVQQMEVESGSDSFTSTSTTTTNTSEAYQRMYAAQVKAYEMQQAYDQSESEFEYNTDMEMSGVQVNQMSLDSQEISNSGRSVHECADSLSAPLNMYKLIDMVREVTPSPIPQQNQGSKHVVFLDEPQIQEASSSNYSTTDVRQEAENYAAEESKTDVRQLIEQFNGMEENQEGDNKQEDQLIIEDRSQILESQRFFQPTPEIIFEIAPVRHIPPTKIPNPTPKEWINPMVRALTTAPEVPFHMVECLCPKPCDDDFISQSKCHRKSLEEERESLIKSVVDNHRESFTEARKSSIKSVEEKPVSPKPPEEPPQFLRESPASGSRFSKAMTTASEFTVRFAPHPSEMVPLPEEHEVYMPPPIDMKPYLREDFRPKSPFLSALTTAPEKPFEGQFDRDVPIHGLDLPTPKEHLSMSSALCIASDREYTPLNPENATHRIEEEKKRKEQKKYEFQVLDHEEELGLERPVTPVEYYVTEKPTSKERKSSAFAAMQAFQPSREPLPTNTPRNSVVSLTKDETDLEYNKYCKAIERNQKRLSYFQKKEDELKSTYNSQTNTNNNINTNHRPSVSSYTQKNNVDSSASYNSSFTVQENNNSNNNNYTTQSPRSSFSASIAASQNKNDVSEVIEETTEELEHSPILFPPPSPLSHLKGKSHSTGLHRPESIPKYQRNWTVLPTQSPSRTPEPQELRENIPLAFVDAHKTTIAVTSDNHVHRPVAIQSVAGNNCSNTPKTTVTRAQRGSIEQKSQLPVINVIPTSVPSILNKDHSGPVNVTFQSLDEYVLSDDSHVPSRPYTPCSMSNKPVPLIPFYQTPEKLCFDECAAAHERPYDLRSASPYPDRAHSPAPGPPPNPLSAIRAPRMKDNELTPHSPRMLQTGSISTGQSYLGAQQQQLEQGQGQLLSHFETTTQAQAQSLSQIPETVECRQIGNMTLEQRRRESHLEEQKKSQTQSQTKTQIGNTQIERRRKVTEEFEHSQTAKTIEIRTGTQSTSTARRESYGKTGFVANQTRRLSSLEQEITNLTSQSQAISARANEMSDGAFPQLKSPEPTSKFPTSPIFPPHDEPKAQSYMICTGANNKLVTPPPGFQGQQQTQRSTHYGASFVTSAQQQQKSLSALSTSQTSSVSTSTLQSSQSNAVSSKLTMASNASTNINCNNNKNLCSSGICKQQILNQSQQQHQQQQHLLKDNANLICSDSNYKYRPNASIGASSGIKPTQQASANFVPQSVALPMQAPPPPVTTNASNVSDQTNLGGSDAGGKGGVIGATSAPKRGRGTINKAVGPGARVPLCNSCQTQIR